MYPRIGFRRAIIEPYETALNKKMSLLIPVLQEYRERVLPVHDRHADLLAYPNEKGFDQTLREIARLRDSARKAKGKNEWNDDWEEGVVDYIDGFELASDLLRSLENAIFKLPQIKKDKAEKGVIKQLRDELAQKDDTHALDINSNFIDDPKVFPDPPKFFPHNSFFLSHKLIILPETL